MNLPHTKEQLEQAAQAAAEHAYKDHTLVISTVVKEVFPQFVQGLENKERNLFFKLFAEALLHLVDENRI